MRTRIVIVFTIFAFIAFGTSLTVLAPNVVSVLALLSLVGLFLIELVRERFDRRLLLIPMFAGLALGFCIAKLIALILKHF